MFIMLMIVSLLSPAVSMVLTPWFMLKDKRNSAKYSLIIGFIFGVIAFSFEPTAGSSSDIVRYFEMVDSMSTVNLKEIFYLGNRANLTVGINFLYFISNRLGSPHFLPAISIFVTYSIIVFITTDLGKRMNVEWEAVLLALLFIICVLPLPALISNVRNIMAFSISLFAVYLDLVKEKRGLLLIFFYIIPIFIHVSSIVILAIRLLILLYNKGSKLLIITAIIIGSSSSVIFNYLIRFIPVGSNFLYYFLSKGSYYVSTTDTEYIKYLENSILAQIQKLYFVGIALFFLLIIYKIRNYKLKPSCLKSYLNEKNINNLLIFMLLLCFVVLGSALTKLTTYVRFSWALIITSSVAIYNIYIIPRRHSMMIYLMLIFIALGGFMHQVLLFFMMSDVFKTLSKFFITNIFNMFL